ncbi:CAP domain-containing protein [Companilactobacillus huachuanensis]|uniref:CAP domain-containing protein n=1 Tax=Companilactobacillus huachuanensis TaxID=2559914 RepID=A0ABW1RKS3_9LACO|nr:CAP domain-containing protein [Companilactobacillus huachuanensis]
MKFMTKSTALVAALAMATTGVLVSSTKAEASTVATVHSGIVARLYTPQGTKISNRALAPNSAWQVGKIATINGEKMYQVSTNEYLRAADSSLNGQQQQSSTRLAGKAMTMLALYRDDTNSMANRSLAPNSEWAIGKYVVNKNGQQFVQVSTHEYADASKLMYTQPMTNPTYIADFGTNTKFSDFAVVGSGNLGTNGDSSSTGDTSTDNNQGSTSTSTSTDPDIDPSLNANVAVGTNGLTYEQIHKRYPKVADVRSAVVETINAERQSRGLAILSEDSGLDSIAGRRAEEISTNFTHYDAAGNSIFVNYLHKEIPGMLSQGENIFGSPWKDLRDQTAKGYANLVLDNYRGEGISTTWNHYSAIINPKATKIGVGIYESSDGSIYTAEDFGK